MKLIIAEKPSVGAEIAKVVGAREKSNGYYTGGEYIVSWCRGHLVSTAMPDAYDEKYAKWTLDTLPIIPSTWKYEVTKESAGQYKILKDLMGRKEVDSLICATDAGREGELIFRLVYNQVGCKKPFERLWINSVEKDVILEGMKNLRPGSEYDNMYHAASCRQKADWLIGMNESRFYTLAYNTKLNIGRVQTPALAMVVKRYEESKMFVPEPYYVITANMGSFTATKRIEQAEQIPQIKVDCTGKKAYVTVVRKEEKTSNPPALYSLSTLQAEANTYFGYTLQQTLDYAQALYEKKLTTYPRSDSNYLPSGMLEEGEKLLHNLLSNSKTEYLNQDQMEYSCARMINDAKVSDHHAIIPTAHYLEADISELPITEKNILMLVAARFVIAAAPPMLFAASQAMLDVSGHTFSATGREVSQMGFKAQENALKAHIKNPEIDEDEKDGEEDDKSLPPLNEGDEILVLDVTDKKYLTKAPVLYTDRTLLEAMKSAGQTIHNEDLKKALKNAGGLGTEATRAGILENLVKNAYLVRKKKKVLPTEKGIQLVKEVQQELKDPELTAQWEMKLESISSGEYNPEQFMHEIIEFVSNHIKLSIEHHDPETTKGVFADERPQKPILGVCPRCGKSVFEGKSNFYCEGGKECGFAFWKNDNFLVSRKATITAENILELLGNKQTTINCKNKEGKAYRAVIKYSDNGKYVNLQFVEFVK